jgi:hypothetical protein
VRLTLSRTAIKTKQNKKNTTRRNNRQGVTTPRLGRWPSGHHCIPSSRHPPPVGVEGERGRRRQPPCVTTAAVHRRREKGASCSPFSPCAPTR